MDITPKQDLLNWINREKELLSKEEQTQYKAGMENAFNLVEIWINNIL